MYIPALFVLLVNPVIAFTVPVQAPAKTKTEFIHSTPALARLNLAARDTTNQRRGPWIACHTANACRRLLCVPSGSTFLRFANGESGVGGSRAQTACSLAPEKRAGRLALRFSLSPYNNSNCPLGRPRSIGGSPVRTSPCNM
jgi:hypothetical protein